LGQAYQESRYRLDAVSPVGAQGLFQFMPGTWRDMQKRGVVPFDVSAFDPKWATIAGAVYMAQLVKSWSSPRPLRDRYLLALASYNAGLGNILAAQKRCRGAVLYEEIMTCLPMVTGHHSKETIGYGRSIEGHVARYLAVSGGRRLDW